MAVFTPPANATEVPPVFPEGSRDQSAMQYNLFRHFRSRPCGRNVYYRETAGVGSVTEDDPVTTYNSDGTANIVGGSDVKMTWYGGHGPYTLTANQQTALVAAGYGAYIT